MSRPPRRPVNLASRDLARLSAHAAIAHVDEAIRCLTEATQHAPPLRDDHARKQCADALALARAFATDVFENAAGGRPDEQREVTDVTRSPPDEDG